MEYNFTARNTTLTEGLRNYAEQKLAHCEKYLNDDAVIKVKLEVKEHEKNPNKVEVTVTDRFGMARAEYRSNDMYGAIDQVEESIVRNLRKRKERRIQKHRQETAKIEAMPKIERVERYKTHPLELLTQEMAIDEMEMTSHSFYVYRDVDKSREVCAVYKRENGTYGVLVFY